MKKQSLRLVLISLVLTSFAHQTSMADNIDIDKSRGGNLIVFIYKDENFPAEEEHAVAMRTFKVQRSTQIVTFSDNDYPDELAFKVLHDEDSNEKTTKNWTGIWPYEGLGYSNDQTLGVLGAPSFDDAKVIKEEYLAGITIKLDY